MASSGMSHSWWSRLAKRQTYFCIITTVPLCFTLLSNANHRAPLGTKKAENRLLGCDSRNTKCLKKKKRKKASTSGTAYRTDHSLHQFHCATTSFAYIEFKMRRFALERCWRQEFRTNLSLISLGFLGLYRKLGSSHEEGSMFPASRNCDRNSETRQKLCGAGQCYRAAGWSSGYGAGG